MKKNIVVIGAGVAGTLICNSLAKNTNVTLLEAGEKNRVSFPKVTFKKKSLGEVKTFCIGGGGGTNLWHNGLIPINVDDITSREFRSVLVNAKKYMNEAAQNLHWDNNSFENEYSEACAEMNALSEDIGVFSDGVDCLLYPKKYKKLEPDSKVNSFYSVTDINFVAENNKIITVKYTINNQIFSTRTDILIISAGSFGTPKLLVRVLSSLQVISNEAGRGFIDHPMGFIGKVRLKKPINRRIKKFSFADKNKYTCRTIIRLKSDCENYTAAVFLRPSLTMNNNLNLYKYKSSIGASSGVRRIRNIFSIKLFHLDVLAEIFSHLFNTTIPGRTYNLLIIFDQKRGDSKISYNHDSIQLDWSISEEELTIYNKMLKKLEGMLEGISDRTNIKSEINSDWLWSCAHHSGVTSLGSKNEDLVDTDLKLNASDNVYVCDASVIQEHSYANTGLTIGQLSMRLSNKILKSVNC